MPDRAPTPAPAAPRLRPAGPGDGALLAALYRAGPAARALAAAGLPPAALDVVLDQQHDSRERAYAAAHPDRDDLVVEVAGRPVGRLLLARRPDELRIVDVALFPDARGRGTGTVLVRHAQDRAAADGVPLRLHADRGGRAEALYRRLGFDDDGAPDPLRVVLAWRP